MGIQEIEIKGFRSLRDVRWKPGKLNVLIGPNGSGKSNLVDACTLLQEAIQGGLSRGVNSRGGLGSLLWDSQEKRLSWNLKIEESENSLLTYFLELNQIGQSNNYHIRETLAKNNIVHLDHTDYELRLRNSKDEISEGKLASGFSFQSVIPLLGGPFGNDAVNDLDNQLSHWEIYQDLRVNQESLARQPNITSFEKRLTSNGQNLVSVLHTLYSENRDFKKSLDMAMRAAFGSEYEEIVIAPAADQRVQLRLRWKSLHASTSAANLSDGTLRFLMLVTILANPEPGDLIAIDEPETGLHPRMFPILAELALNAAERTQVILTTHSPEFLNAFRAEAPTTTVAELVDGETHLSVVDPEELARWLKEYSLGSIFSSGELEAIA